MRTKRRKRNGDSRRFADRSVAKKGYKLVYKLTSGRLLSCHLGNSAYRQRNRAKTYTPGIWTKPSRGCGPLCIFDSLTTARRFHTSQIALTHQARVIIRNCVYVPSLAPGIWLSATQYKGKRAFVLSSLPWGTRLADRVKLIPVKGEPGYGKA